MTEGCRGPWAVHVSFRVPTQWQSSSTAPQYPFSHKHGVPTSSPHPAACPRLATASSKLQLRERFRSKLGICSRIKAKGGCAGCGVLIAVSHPHVPSRCAQPAAGMASSSWDGVEAGGEDAHSLGSVFWRKEGNQEGVRAGGMPRRDGEHRAVSQQPKVSVLILSTIPWSKAVPPGSPRSFPKPAQPCGHIPYQSMGTVVSPTLS